MYEINGVYKEKLHSTGQVLRQRATFRIQLNTPKGVERFIDDHKPFVEISIKDLILQKDVTAEFIKAGVTDG